MTKSRTRQTPISTDPATAYALAVRSGEIVAGPHVRDAAARHLADLADGPKRGLVWDTAAAERFYGFCRDVLRLGEGQFDGAPFELDSSQKFICGSLFGWKWAETGKRRFRRAYIEQGKGNGKSPMVGAIGLYGLVADGEAGAQIYAAGATKEQASILFRDAVNMADKAPSLGPNRIRRSGGPGREYNLAHLKSGSFFRPVSRETKKTGSGPRPHFALCDEVHEHPDGGVIEILERGFKFREQPLLVMITNSGSDRKSICWQERKHAVAVASGEVLDDTTFAYVCALDEARKAVYSFDISLRNAAESCTCSAPITQIDLPSPQDFAALVTQRSVGRIISPKGLDAPLTQTGQLFLDAFVTLATRGGGKRITRYEATSGEPSCETTPRANEPRNSLEIETLSTGSERSSPILTGKLIGQESVNTEYPASRPLRLELIRAEDAGSAGTAKAVFGWITATIVELFGASCATNAMLELVCSEIMPKLFGAHSDTCSTRQHYHLEYKRLAENLPADDPLNDPSCWIKANPLLGVTITEDYLAIQVKQAKDIPAKANGIRRLHFCQWTDAESAWISRAMWEAIEDPSLDLEDFAGRRCWAGLDLSAKVDITAKALVFEDGAADDGKPKFAAFVHGYTPADTLRARAEMDGAPYDLWVDAGYLTATPGKKTRLDFVAADLLQDADQFDLDFAAYDNYLIADFEAILGDMGASLPLLDHPQGWNKRKRETEDGEEIQLWMPGSVDELETLIMEKRIRVHVNPALRSAVFSATFDRSPADLRRFTKHKSTGRIDMAVALCMAVGAATARASGEAESSYLEASDLVII